MAGKHNHVERDIVNASARPRAGFQCCAVTRVIRCLR